MSKNHLRQGVAISAQQLLNDRNCSEEIAGIAGDVIGLTALLDTWPIPRSSDLDEDWGRKVSELCRRVGRNLCGARQCTTHRDNASDALCGVSPATHPDERHP